MSNNARLRRFSSLCLWLCVILATISLVACRHGSSDDASPLVGAALSGEAASVAEPVVGYGDNSHQVLFAENPIGLNTLNLKIRMVPPPADGEDVEASLVSATGTPILVRRATVEGDSFVLAAVTTTLSPLVPFDSVVFSRPIPQGTRVEIINADLCPAEQSGDAAHMGASRLRASTYSIKRRCDYDDDGRVTSHDIALFMAWMHLKTNDAAKILALAQKILPAVSKSMVNFPDPLIDNFDADSEKVFGNEDIVFLIAGYQTNSTDRTLVGRRARELLPTIQQDPVFLPGDQLPTVPLTSVVSGQNTQSMQVHLRNVSGAFADFPDKTPIALLKGRDSSNVVRDVELGYSVALNTDAVRAAEKVIFTCNTTNLLSILDFQSIFFYVPLPAGAVVEVINRDAGDKIVSGEARPATPEIIAPTNSQQNVSTNPVVRASAFAGASAGSIHTATDWEVYSYDTYGQTLRWSKYDDRVNLVSITVDARNGMFVESSWSELYSLENYKVRVRYRDQNAAVSVWSELVPFKTWRAPDKPSVNYPNEYERYPLNPSLESNGFFSYYDPERVHAKTDWEVYANSVEDTSLVWFAYGDGNNLTTTRVDDKKGTFTNVLTGRSSLDFGTEYHVRFRNYNDQNVPSPWSDARRFTTIGYSRPMITLPASGSLHVDVNPKLKSTVFMPANPDTSHSRSEWEIYDSADVVTGTRVWRCEPNYNYLNEIEVRDDQSSLRFDGTLAGKTSLESGTTYYVRVRHLDSLALWSEWSALSPFQTWIPPDVPTIVSPANEETEVVVLPVITASAFSSADTEDRLEHAEWEIVRDLVYKTMAYSGRSSGESLTLSAYPSDGEWSWSMTSLDEQAEYWVRVRYVNSHGAASEWSEYSAFTTFSPPQAPSIDVSHGYTEYPGYIRKGTGLNPRLTGGSFRDDNGEDQHTATDWEIWNSADTAKIQNRVWYSATTKDTELKGIDVTSAQGTFANALAGRTALDASSVYLCRVRYYDNHGTAGAWSNLLQFFTQNAPLCPTILSPSPNQTHVGMYAPMLVGSDFADWDQSETHTKTDWEVFESADLTPANRVWYKLGAVYDHDGDFRTSIPVDATRGTFENTLSGRKYLTAGTTYHVRVRYYDSHSLPSEWSAPVSFVIRPGVRQVACGGYSSYALLTDGSLWAWGYNSSGQLGINNMTNKYAPVRVELPSGVSVATITAGANFGAATNQNGDVYTWGGNTSGQLGDGGFFGPRTVPAKVSGISQVRQIQAGDDFVVALTTSGVLYAWGQNQYGQLGNGGQANKAVPTAIANAGGLVFTHVSVGKRHVLAVATNKKVYAWGYGADGQLGNGATSVNLAEPFEVPVGEDVKLAFAGADTSYAVTEGGDLYVWGKSYGSYSNDNQKPLGYSTNESVLTPRKITSVEANGVMNTSLPPVFIAQKTRDTTGGWAVAVRSDGSVVYWGRGSLFSRKSDLPRVVAADSGYDYGIAAKADGTIWAWGYQDYGAFGINAWDTDQTDLGSSLQTRW